MFIKKIEVSNIKSLFGTQEISPSKRINLLVGHNSSGKSTLLRVIYQLQGFLFNRDDISLDSDFSESILLIDTDQPEFLVNKTSNQNLQKSDYEFLEAKFSLNSTTHHNISRKMRAKYINHFSYNDISFLPFERVEGENLIYPYFSNRKVSNYSKRISPTERKKLDGNLENLYAKIDHLSRPGRPLSTVYANACQEIIGYFIGADQDEDGKYANLAVDDTRNIPITAMGDGIPNILGLITDLCLADNNIFLIEEPENDLHPKALRALLSLIEKKSANNQFFISTHSNVVLRYLGASPATKVFQIAITNNFKDKIKIPKSVIKEVSDSPLERQQLLEDLGYEMFDYALWKGWLFLEESSAEVIIREFLIPQFAPSLINKLRTYSAKSISKIERQFEDFNNLFVYVHLDTSYRNRAWVIIDSGENEKLIIDKMKAVYQNSGWNETQFRQFSKHNFEDYYPSKFILGVQKIYAIENEPVSSRDKKDRKREAKKELLDEVKLWYTSYPEEAKKEFETSAHDVISILKEIESSLL